MQVRLVVIAPHDLVSHGMARLLDDALGMVVVARSTRAEEGLARIATLRPDVAVVSVDLPGRAGLDVCGEAARTSPRTRCVLLANHNGYSVARQEAATSHVVGVIRPAQSLAEVEAVLRTAGGKDRLPGVAAPHARPSPREADPRHVLTPRELVLFAFLGEGLTNPEIASRMNVAVPTVRNYVSLLLRKMRLPNRGRLISLAARLAQKDVIEGAGQASTGDGNS